MVDFGYNINKDRQIEFDINDRKMSDYIRKYEPSFDLCIACGTCTSTCTAANLTDFNIMRLIIFIKRGEVANVEKEIKKCMLCGKCYLACPRGVNTRNMILKILEAIEKINTYEI